MSAFCRRRTHRMPSARPVPIVHEASSGAAIIAAQHAAVHTLRYTGNLCECQGAHRTHLSQQMEDRWLVKRDARNPIRPGERRVQRDSTAIGMAHEVNLTGARTNQRDRAARFVSEREGVLAGPHFGALIAVVLP